jgi:Domain of unknown function (DUF4394)
MNLVTFALLRRCSAVLIVAAFATFTLKANAVLMYGYNVTGNRLLTFESDAPGTILSDVALTGLLGGESLLGIDIRPATGQLYGIASARSGSMRIVTIDPQTGSVTQVNTAPLVIPAGTFFGMAFNPIVDRIRFVSDGDANLRLAPDTGALVAADVNLAYVAGDANVGANPTVAQVAYTNAFAAAAITTLYGIDTTTNTMVRIGAPSPNGGELTTVGALGVDPTSSVGGFAISPKGNRGYTALRIGSVSVLHKISLSSGAAVAIGPIGSGTTIDGLAIAPPTECLDLDGDRVISATTDGLMLLRALLGMTGTSVTTNALPTPTPPRSTWDAIRTHLNSNCGMTFAP